ncbi:MAG: hypothetical protein ACI4OT_02320 [Bacilli bacterium]
MLVANNKTKKGKIKISKTSIIISILVFVILLSMGTGYAVLSQELNLFGNSKIELPEYKIYIADVKTNNAENGAYEATTATYTDNEVGLYTILPNTNSIMTYDVTIKNIGKTDAVVDYIYSSNNNSNIKYKIVGTNATKTIKALSTLTIKVIVEMVENATSINQDSSILLNFAFIKKTSDYSNECTNSWDGTSSSEPIISNIMGNDYYQITNANEFKWFADQINSGNTGINGMLTKDICLNSQTFTSIGSSSAYTGVFDGQNRNIKELNYSRNIDGLDSDSTYNAGLFINNNGTIKNLNVEGTNSDTHSITGVTNTSNIGGIVVNNTGVIENSSYKGTITINATARVNCLVKQGHTYNYVGGIASNNSGIIRGSYNNATFNLSGSTSYGTCNLYTRSANITSGGIAGINSGYVVDSYNNANMTATGKHQSTSRSTYNGLIGGVVGSNSNICNNSYNSGNITQTLPSGGYGSSQTGVIATNSGTINNVYFLTGTINNNVGTEVNANDLINLNINIGNAFLLDSANINNGYPILFWE